jgi:ABC-type polysaccharide/polyol phosphate export permease
LILYERAPELFSIFIFTGYAFFFMVIGIWIYVKSEKHIVDWV